MMLCDLPEDVLASVLGRCADTSNNSAPSLKYRLPLLAVCRLWRRLAIPLVYSRVFVKYGDPPVRQAGRSIRNPDVEEPTNVAVKTNLDLVKMVDGACAVKRVQLDVHCLANPFPGWRDTIQRMCTLASKWRVVELTLMIHTNALHFDRDNVDMAKYAEDIAEVADALAALMPDVRRLACRGSDPNPIARSFYGHLASHYADQLLRFVGQYSITVPLDRQFTRLKVFRLTHDFPADYQLPQMMTGALADMWLANLPSYHSWAPFSTDSNSQVIEFPKLKRLWAIYFTVNRDGGFAGRHRDGHPWRLHFPSLKTLNVECTQNTCPLLEYAVLPPHMESIHIQLHVATYLSIANLVLPRAKRIAIRTTSGASGDASGLPAINRILESACASESLGLEINDRLLPVVPESITCTTLTQLLIAARTSLDTMLAFIERLPRLVSLTLYDLGVNAIQTDISVPDADEETVVEPLHTSLESLTIKYDIWTHSPDRAVAVAKFVLLKIPTLTKLLAVQTPESPVISFAEEYAPRYPHLSDVELELYRR